MTSDTPIDSRASDAMSVAPDEKAAHAQDPKQDAGQDKSIEKRLQKIVVTKRETDHFEVDDWPRIFDAFERHQELEEVDAWGLGFELDAYRPVPWPLKLRSLSYSAVCLYLAYQNSQSCYRV